MHKKLLHLKTRRLVVFCSKRRAIKPDGVKIIFFSLYMLWFNFILGLNFFFLLFLGMVICDNEFETKENKI